MNRWGVACMLFLMGAAILGTAVPTVAPETVNMPFANPVASTVDGVIGPGEYPSSSTDSVTGIVLSMVHDGTNMTVGITSPGTGWVGIGFGIRGTSMDGANILIGYVSGSTTVLTDQVGVGFDHVPDTDLGGSNNILQVAGSESGGKTTIEFRYPLKTGDGYDSPLVPGKTYGMILAYHDTADDLVSQHTAASMLYLTVGVDPDSVPTKLAQLVFDAEGTPREGGNVTLVVTVIGDGGAPLEDAEIDLYLNSSVGLGLLATVESDRLGIVSLQYTFLSGGEFRFVARFSGDYLYLPAEANLTLVAASADAADAFSYLDLAVRVILITVLAGVALAYVYTVSQIVRIRQDGSRIERQLRQALRGRTQMDGRTGALAGQASKVDKHERHRSR